MGEIAHTPAAQAVSAAEKLAQRDNALKSAAAKKAIAEERRKHDAMDALKDAEHAGALNAVRQAHAEELERHDARWEREEAKHGTGKFYSGVSVGMFVTAALVSVGLALFTNSIIAPTFDAAAQARIQQDVVDTTRRYAEPVIGP